VTEEDKGPVTIRRLAESVCAPMAMKAAMQVELFTPLADGAMTADELAGALNLKPDRLGLLLYALVAAGLLTEQDGRFANTAEADRFLVRGRPGYMGSQHFLYDQLWAGALGTGDSLQSGSPGAKHDFASMSADDLEEFYRGTHSGALAAGHGLAEMADLSAARRLVDVGGGSGGVSIGLCRAYPELRATVAEFEAVVPITRSIIAQEGMADRVEAVAADAVARRLDGDAVYDVAVLRNLIQVLSADQASSALAHIAPAMKPGGVIYIWGWMLDDSRLAPEESVLHNVVFINLYDHGQAHTEGEHRQWLAAAGFADIERRVLPGGFSLMSARKT
jgi:predicted O-methyltransferase YrrM